MSSRFDNGVKWYDLGHLSVTISFPEGERKCKWCGMKRRDGDSCYRCILTNRILYSAEYIPPECPIIFENTEEQSNAEI